MSLLPRQHSQFAKEDFWDDFFKARGSKSFDWYGEYPELCGVLHKYIKPADQVLMVGCGNSKLSEDLYDLSYHNITNIDVSDVVIKQMSQKNGKSRPKMSFIKMDATKMSFEDKYFKSAIDKGTLDAVLPDPEHSSLAVSMLDEVWRVIKSMGSYIIVSLAQDHVLSTLINAFKERPCIFRVHKLPKSESGGFLMPVFAFVITKPIAAMPSIYESSVAEGKITRHSTSEEIVTLIKEIQYYAVLQNTLSKRKMEGEQPKVALYTPDIAHSPRYTIYIVESPKRYKNKFAVFISPQGQENNWMFSTNEGRLQLLSNIEVERLLVVTLARGHTYKDVEEIKTELSSKVMELAPHGTNEKNVPFLAMAEGVGIRNIVYESEAEKLGLIYVEDVNTDADTMLRQTFCEKFHPELAFSSARLKTVKSKGSTARTVDVSQLVSDVEKVLASLTCFYNRVGDEPLPNLLIVGLKCGTLANFLSTYHRGIVIESVQCVEAEKVLIDIANRFYSLDDKVTVTTLDTYNSLDQLPSHSGYGCIIINTDMDVETLGKYLQLISSTGLFVAKCQKEESGQLLELLKLSLTHCGCFHFDDISVVFGSSTEISSSNKTYHSNMSRLIEKTKIGKNKNASEPMFSLDFSSMVISDH